LLQELYIVTHKTIFFQVALYSIIRKGIHSSLDIARFWVIRFIYISKNKTLAYYTFFHISTSFRRMSCNISFIKKWSLCLSTYACVLVLDSSFFAFSSNMHKMTLLRLGFSSYIKSYHSKWYYLIHNRWRMRHYLKLFSYYMQECFPILNITVEIAST
jgi:hypothetical protein